MNVQDVEKYFVRSKLLDSLNPLHQLSADIINNCETLHTDSNAHLWLFWSWNFVVDNQIIRGFVALLHHQRH